MTTPTPDAAAALQAANARADRYLEALFRAGFEPLHGVATRSGNKMRCEFCGGMAPTRAAVVHAPGCVFAGLDAATVAALDADWTPTA